MDCAYPANRALLTRLMLLWANSSNMKPAFRVRDSQQLSRYGRIKTAEKARSARRAYHQEGTVEARTIESGTIEEGANKLGKRHD